VQHLENAKDGVTLWMRQSLPWTLESPQFNQHVAVSSRCVQGGQTMMRRKQDLTMHESVCNGTVTVFIGMPASEISERSESGGQQRFYKNLAASSGLKVVFQVGPSVIRHVNNAVVDTHKNTKLAASTPATCITRCLFSFDILCFIIMCRRSVVKQQGSVIKCLF
jgi:hypothetical protein